ncbi:MAG: rod shape-determining protein MreC [Acidobacteriota bacterium]|nr:rod shape-determining protein MreC [Acidobacteriota bacterium]
MIQFFLERRSSLLLFTVLFILLVLLSSQARNEDGASLLESVLFRAVTPIARVTHSIADGSTRWIDEWVDLKMARVENLALAEELGRLRFESQRWQAERHEYLRLLSLLGLQERLGHTSVPARVISRGHGLGASTLIIDRGSRDGLATNQPVIVSDGVAGRLVEVGPFASKVQLALDPNCSIAAITERTRAQGLVNGRGRGHLRMEYVSDLEDVQPGDRIVTSGLDRVFPAGITVGTVLRTDRRDGLVQTIEVEPSVDFNKLEEVLVLIDEGKPEG